MIWTPAKIKAFERKYNVSCNLRDDDMYDVSGTINMAGRDLKNLSTLPPIHTIRGNFRCNNNELKNLKGSPIKVLGSFFCSANMLTTIEGAPEYIGENFFCYNNPNLLFSTEELDAMNIQGTAHYDPEKLVPEDPSVYIERGLLPI